MPLTPQAMKTSPPAINLRHTFAARCRDFCERVLARYFSLRAQAMKPVCKAQHLLAMPSTTPVLLVLIQEELKSRRLFAALRAVGLDDCYLPPCLDQLILLHIGLDDDSPDTFAWYTTLMDKHARKVGDSLPSVRKEALQAYGELTAGLRLRRQRITLPEA